MEQAQAATPWQEWAKRANEAGAASFAIGMQYRGEERTTELPLTQDMIGQLAFEAAIQSSSSALHAAPGARADLIRDTRERAPEENSKEPISWVRR